MALARRYQDNSEARLAQKIVTWIAIFEVGLLCGLEAVFFAVVSNTPPFDSAYGSPSATFQGIATALYPIFAAVGSVSVLYFGQFCTSKAMIVGSVWVWLAGYLIVVLLITRAGLIIGRILKGLAIGIILSVIPPYAHNVMSYPANARLLVAVQASIPLGIFIMSLLSTQIYHRNLDEVPFHRMWVLAGIPAFPAVVLTMFIMPEKPKMRHLTYEQILNAKRISVVSSNYRRFIVKVRKTIDKLKRPWSEVTAIFGNQKHLSRFLFACLVQISVPLTGINIVLYFVGTVCRLAGVPDAQVKYFSLGIYACNFLATIVSITFVDRLPPVPTLRWTMVALSVVQFFTGVLLSIAETEPPHVAGILGAAALALLFVFVFVFSVFYSGISYVVTSDSCPPRFHATSLGLAVASGWIVNAIFTIAANKIMESLGPATFCVFGFTCALFSFFFSFRVLT